MTWLTWRQFRAQAAAVSPSCWVAVAARPRDRSSPSPPDLVTNGADVYDSLTLRRPHQVLFFAGAARRLLVPGASSACSGGRRWWLASWSGHAPARLEPERDPLPGG